MKITKKHIIIGLLVAIFMAFGYDNYGTYMGYFDGNSLVPTKGSVTDLTLAVGDSTVLLPGTGFPTFYLKGVSASGTAVIIRLEEVIENEWCRADSFSVAVTDTTWTRYILSDPFGLPPRVRYINKSGVNLYFVQQAYNENR